MDLQQQRSDSLAGEQWCQAVPGDVAPAGRQVKVEPERVDPRRVGLAAAGAEVVVKVEEHRAIERRLDQLQRVGEAQAGDDVGVPEIRFAIERRMSGVKERASRPG